MSDYTVKQTARLAGVSVRTLHHYDEIGLLRPGHVGANGYRYYGREELLRLQQILFHRELGFSLEEIRAALDAPGFDRIAALKAHKARLAKAARRYRTLMRTIDDTLAALEGGRPMTDKAMYRGFPPEKQAEYESWLVDRYGGDMQARIDQSKAKVAGWSDGEFADFQAELEANEAAMAKALADGLPADSAAVGELMRKRHRWVARAWKREPTAEAFAGLGRLYQDHPDFRARYEGLQAGLTDYLAEAMRVFAERELA